MKGTPGSFTHPLIRDTAEALAQEWYESAAHDNEFYKHFPDRAAFVKHALPNFIGMARTILARMLGQNRISEAEKAEVAEALIKEKALHGADIQYLSDTKH